MQQVRSLKLRSALIADADLLLAWRNDPQTRLASRSSEVITAEDHQVWLSRILGSSDHVMQIAEADGKPVGVVRADRAADGWELSWTVAPAARKHGVGSHMLIAFVAGLDGRLAAVIRKDNSASIQIAAAAGLKHVGDASDTNFGLWTREK